MKKISTFFLAIFTVMAVNAELLMHETFPTPGQLDAGYCIYSASNNPVKIDTIPGYQSMWWSFCSAPSPTAAKPGYLWTQVVADHGMSYSGYASEVIGGAAHVMSDITETTTTNHYTTNDLHYFAPVAPTAGNRVYASFLMNFDEIETNGISTSGTWQKIAALSTDSSNTGHYGYLEILLNTTTETFRFGVEKNSSDYFYSDVEKNRTTKTNNLYNTNPAAAYNLTGYRSGEYNMHETYLVVIEYIFVNDALKVGTQKGNDSVNVYINPTLNNKVPTIHTLAYSDTTTNATSGAQTITWQGQVKSADPTKPLRFFKFFSGKYLKSMYYDQVKVATAWEDLFEGSLADPAIDVNTHEITKYVVPGGGFADSIQVVALNLEDDLTIEPADPDTKLEVEDDEFDADDEELATGVTIHFSASGLTENGTDTLIVYSGSAEQRVAINWVVIPTVTSLTEVHDTVYYTGNAQVTYNAVTHNGIRLTTIQDESGAIAVDNLESYAVGDVVTNLVLLGSKKAAVQTSHPGLVYKVSSAEHSAVAYKVTPLVVKAGSVNLAEHLYKLVELDTVGLSGLSDNFSNLSIARNSVEGASNFYVLTPTGNSLLNTKIPATANVVGVVNGIGQTVIDPNAAVWKFICPRGIEDVEEVLIPTMSFSDKTVNIEGTMCVDSSYTSTLELRGSHIVPDSVVVLEANGVTLGSYTLTGDSVNKKALVTITIAPTEVDLNWRGTVYAYYNAPRYKMLVDSVVLNGKVDAPTLSFSVDTVKMDTMYVDSVYNTTVELTGTNLQLLYPTNVVALSTEGVAVELDEVTVDSISNGAIVAITITPSEANAEWEGSVVASYGNVTATVVLTGVVKNNTVIPSGMDAVGTKTRAMKVVRDGQVRIVRGENEFTVLGEQVK